MWTERRGEGLRVWLRADLCLRVLQEPYTSPVPPALYPHFALTLLSIGVFFLANFFVYVRICASFACFLR